MNPQVWWFLARASGLVAWALLTLSVVLGAVLRTRLLPRLRPAPIAHLHRFLAGLAMTFTALHLIGLLLDGYIGFGLRDVLVPFGASWRPVPVALGVIAGYLMVAVLVTSVAMRHLPRRVWATVHRSSYLTFWFATAHVLSAGTDASHPAVLLAVAVAGGLVCFLSLLRVLSPDPDPAVRAGALFQRLTVRRVEPQGTDAVALILATPAKSRAAFRYRPGQHVLLKMPGLAPGTPSGARPYSIYASGPDELRIAIRQIPGGAVSTWANRVVHAGDVVEVSPPRGTFGTDPNPAHRRHLLLIGAGSGVTPLFSIASAVLGVEAESRVSFLLANRSRDRVMLADELQTLRARYPHRFHLVNVLSQEARPPEIAGRLGADLVRELAGPLQLATVDEAYLCGPEVLMAELRAVLGELGIAPDHVHAERFAATAPSGETLTSTSGAGGGSEATIVICGQRARIPVQAGESLLDAGLRAGLELPHSCRVGVCGSCAATVSPRPDAPGEAGSVVLTCQTGAPGPDLFVDFDSSLVR